MQDLLGELFGNLRDMQVGGVAYERGREKDYEQARDGVIA